MSEISDSRICFAVFFGRNLLDRLINSSIQISKKDGGKIQTKAQKYTLKAKNLKFKHQQKQSNFFFALISWSLL